MSDDIYEYSSKEEEAKFNFERLKTSWARNHVLEATLRRVMDHLITIESLAFYNPGKSTQMKLIANIAVEARKKASNVLPR